MNARAVKEKLLPLTLAVSAMVVSLVVPEGFDYAAAARGMPATSGGFNTILWLVILATGFYFSGKKLRDSKSVLFANRFFLGLVVLATLSYLWSIAPPVTMRRILRIFAVVSVCVAFASYSKTVRSFQEGLRPVLTIMLIGSIFFVITNPTYGVEQLTMSELVGAWKGLTTQKNALGALATIGFLLWLHAWITGQAKQPWPIVGMIAAAICVINSRSSTSIMATVFSSILMLMLMKSPGSLKRSMPYFVGIFVSILLVYSLAVLKLIPGSEALLSPIAAITGKDLTFSGRTAIWDIINQSISYHPLLGTGYGAYWIGADPSSPSFETLIKLLFYPTEAHNGYLDVINDLGWVGGILLLGYIITFLRQSLQLYKVDRSQGAIYLVILFHQMIGNLSESMWFNIRGVQFVIVTLATTCLIRGLQLHEASRVAGSRMPPPPAASSPSVRPANADTRSAWEKLRNR
ncbi:MAG TPA: O-antigen ligase family protein [Steroidobacteraceae bacterium]|nr:O-antigen ligase family protein [Steroidobacteraceae bacterium]